MRCDTLNSLVPNLRLSGCRINDFGGSRLVLTLRTYPAKLVRQEKQDDPFPSQTLKRFWTMWEGKLILLP